MMVEDKQRTEQSSARAGTKIQNWIFILAYSAASNSEFLSPSRTRKLPEHFSNKTALKWKSKYYQN
jgi:hypothetical protein